MSLASISGASSPTPSQKTGTGTGTDAAFYFNSLLRAPLEVAFQPTPRSLHDVRRQIAEEIAAKLSVTAQDVDGKTHEKFHTHQNTPLNVSAGTRIGVRLVGSNHNDEEYLRLIVSKTGEIRHRHLFAIGIEVTSVYVGESTLIVCGSGDELITRAMLLIKAKFMDRIVTDTFAGDMWIASVLDLGRSPYDEDALLDAIRKAAKTPVDPLNPPVGSKGIEETLHFIRAKLLRVTAKQAYDELIEPQVDAPTFLVDIRPKEQRDKEGDVPGALLVDRNILEWKFDPRSSTRLDVATRYDLRVILLCQDGNASRYKP